MLMDQFIGLFFFFYSSSTSISLKSFSQWSNRCHESQLSEADWHLHSTHDPDEVQVDPRGLSDVTDEEEVQVCFKQVVSFSHCNLSAKLTDHSCNHHRFLLENTDKSR